MSHKHEWKTENGRAICKVQGCLPNKTSAGPGGMMNEKQHETIRVEADRLEAMAQTSFANSAVNKRAGAEHAGELAQEQALVYRRMSLALWRLAK